MVQRIELADSCDWWASNVRSARVVSLAAGELEALVVLGPEPTDARVGRPGEDTDPVERARERSRPWIGRRHPGVLTLLGVEKIGRRTGWVYETFEGVSLGAAMRGLAAPLPLRVAVELVASCADIFETLGAQGGLHPGLDLDDVLLLPDGSILLAGFVGPSAPSPVHRDPRGAEDSGTAVWRLGVLLAQLLTGSPPGTATDRVAHELVLRRLLIKIMSRPGPMFPERLRDWQCAMLAWSAEERPMGARIAPGLREIAVTLGEPDLPSWAARWVPEIRASPPSPDAPPVQPAWMGPVEIPRQPLRPGGSDASTERTEEIQLADTPLEDDVTAISTDGDPPRPFAPPEHGTIPVHVGPPPEAVPKVSTLPEELFGTPLVRTETPAPSARRELTLDLETSRWRRATGASLVLFLVALALFWYLVE